MEGFKESTAWLTTNPRYEETFDMVSECLLAYDPLEIPNFILYAMGATYHRSVAPTHHHPTRSIKAGVQVVTTSSSAANAVLNS